MADPTRKDHVVRPLLIQALTDGTVCERVRIEEPQRLLNTVPGVQATSARQIGDFLPIAADPQQQRVFIWQRQVISLADAASVRLYRDLQHAGSLIVGELDDSPLFLPIYWDNDSWLTLRACHCLQTSTEPLAAILRRYNPHVAVFPNQVFELRPLPAHRRRSRHAILRCAEPPGGLAAAAACAKRPVGRVWRPLSRQGGARPVVLRLPANRA